MYVAPKTNVILVYKCKKTVIYIHRIMATCSDSDSYIENSKNHIKVTLPIITSSTCCWI